MLVLGIILIVVGAGVLLAVIAWGANDPAVYHAGALNLDLSVMTVFLLGAATLLVVIIGLGLVRSGLRGARQRRKERKELTRLKQRESQPPGTGGGAPGGPGTTSTGTSSSEQGTTSTRTSSSAGDSPTDPS
jgi:hypothetical protein